MKLSSGQHPTEHPVVRHSDLPVTEHNDMGGGGNDVAVHFKRFCLLPRARALLVDGRPSDIGSRAFDLLTVLLEARGTVVTKNEIMSRVWPDTVVDECNLRLQMSTLRKVLGEDRDVIKTIPGRGYVFVGETTWRSAKPDSSGRTRSEAAAIQLGHFPSLQDWPTGSPMTGPSNEAEPSVVVIDDDPDIREALQGLLRSVGLRTELFASVREFLDSPRPDLPGCLILDVRLPGRSGLEFQEDLAKAKVHLPVIFITGHADVPMSVRAMKAGAVEFLTKPVRHQDLLEAIQRAIELDNVRRTSRLQ